MEQLTSASSYNAPTVKFLIPCYHPSVDTQGNICLDILKDKGSALGDVRTIPLSAKSLLGETNIDKPFGYQALEKPIAFKMYCKKPTQRRSPAKNLV
ncbi:hypothetical protein GH733_010334 [Mirounga leonina]|nr:hypothetical protein GH733_010334 [Mirounga leonina]